VFFEVALLSRNHVPERGTAQKSRKVVELNGKLKTTGTGTTVVTSRYLELSRIQHVFHTYTIGNVYVNIFCNYAGSSLPVPIVSGQVKFMVSR
jgi:hypothetical protein